MPRAAIDIGSQSLLLTVLDDSGRLLRDEARVVRLGAGLGDRGLFQPDRMEAARAVLAEFAATAEALGVAPAQIRAAATSAARRALNAETFFARIRAETGIEVAILSGEEEARLTWLGALHGLPLPEGPSAVIDLGGGSTELVLGDGERITSRVSLELGAVRLTEAYLSGAEGPVSPRALARLRAHLDEVFGDRRAGTRPRSVLAVGGTASTLAAMDAGLASYEAEVVHGYTLTRLTLRRWIDALLSAGPEELRRLVAVAPQRAPYMLAGAAVLDRALELLGRQSLRVSAGGLRFGLLTGCPETGGSG